MPTGECRTSLLQLVASIADTPADKISVAIGASAFPLYHWRDELREFSSVATDMMPFFAITWFVIQIIYKIIEGPRRHHEEGDHDAST